MGASGIMETKRSAPEAGCIGAETKNGTGVGSMERFGKGYG